MRKRREFTENVGFILVGIGVILVAALRLTLPHFSYAPDDVRSQPWFHPAFSGFLVAFGLLAVIVGIVRLIRGGKLMRYLPIGFVDPLFGIGV